MVITGFRRVGKSSLVRIYLNEREDPFMSIDVRKLYEMSFGNISSLHLTRLIGEELNKISKIEKLSSFLRKIRGISIHEAQWKSMRNSSNSPTCWKTSKPSPRKTTRISSSSSMKPSI
ncbi:MAG: hypothetical protein QMC97_07535 [Pseudothermotoga sp.]|uniref:hypothetical protein n=1 Tax=Pseudothermotoga sp. TaxID=2033661 RepID=UPI00258E9B73|nr:hypothetical protein [Pseudothermotoga sp.]MDI6863211.1 hypothetical protein [Pseudothermotoga sp.]